MNKKGRVDFSSAYSQIYRDYIEMGWGWGKILRRIHDLFINNIILYTIYIYLSGPMHSARTNRIKMALQPSEDKFDHLRET